MNHLLKRFVPVAILFCGAVQVVSAAEALNFEGTYLCQGFDKHDGAYQNAKLTLTQDKKNSMSEFGYHAYKLRLDDGGDIYTGGVAANGNTLAIYFENTAHNKPTDRGIGIAQVNYEKANYGSSNSKTTVVINKFYYEPSYQGGGNGLERCVKK